MSGQGDRADLDDLAAELAAVGREVRDAVLAVPATAADAGIVRREGGDVVFGVDARADTVLIDALRRRCDLRWPGSLVIEGFDDRPTIGDATGPWVFIADPVDGTRPWLAGKRSAWILLGAGRAAQTLEDLEVGAAIELPTARARLARVAWAVAPRGSEPAALHAQDDDLTAPECVPVPVDMRPQAGDDLTRGWVTVARFSPGHKERFGAFEDALLGDIEVYEDPYLCSGGQLLGVASGQDAAVLDPRPLLGSAFCAHPYDLSALVVARAAGAIVEALPAGGPLDVPLDPEANVAFAAYANETIAARLRPRAAELLAGVSPGRPASPAPRPAGTG